MFLYFGSGISIFVPDFPAHQTIIETNLKIYPGLITIFENKSYISVAILLVVVFHCYSNRQFAHRKLFPQQGRDISRECVCLAHVMFFPGREWICGG
jgi:hypothetical protein